MRPSGAGLHGPGQDVVKDRPPVTPRTRKLVGTIALLVFLTVYALAAMVTAIILQVSASKAVELAYYVIAGLLWVIPAGLLIKWMQRPEPEIPGAGKP
jgi:hypothetical protein